MKNLFVCDDCVRRAGLIPKSPADSGSKSWLCDCCKHYNIGSKMACSKDGWGHYAPTAHIDIARAAGRE